MSYLDSAKNFISRSISNFAIIIAVFYVSGFLSFLVYYRVLGIDHIEGSTQIYAEFAGRSLILIIQTFLLSPFILFNEQINFAWGNNALLMWAIMTILMIAFAIVTKYYLNSQINEKKLIKIICLIGLISITLPIIKIELEVISIKNVLQPFGINGMVDIKNNVLAIQEEKLANNTLTQQNKLKNLEKFAGHINKYYENDNEIEKLFHINTSTDDRFYDDKLENGDNKRLNVFMTLVLVITITISLLFIYYSLYKYKFIEIIAIVFIISQILFVPFLYGVLGKEYKYPIISFSYKDANNNTIKKEEVILLETTRDTLIIYDRLNFFSINYIKKDSIIFLQKIFMTSPFANCSDERFKPCELYTLQ